jgi:tetratricopeptide (TPR) repeat protein
LLKAQHADPTLDRLDFDLGVASYKGMHLDDAVKYSTKATELRPNDLTALALLAASEVKLSQWQDAEPIFKKILSANGEDTSSLLGLGRCELELKQYQASIDDLKHLLELDPTQMLAHFYLSRAYMGLGDTGDAQHEADLHSGMMGRASLAATSRDSEHEKAVWEKARALLVENHEAEALQLFRSDARGPAASPGEPYVFVGALYLYMSKRDDAVRELKHALEVEPSVRGAHTYLGILALQEGDLGTAENEFSLELAHNPNYQLAIAELGEVRYRQGRWPDAVDELSRSKTIEPSLLYMLCDSYFHTGKVKDADLTAELLTAYSKGDPEVMRGLIDLLKRNQQTELAQRLSSKPVS